MYLRLTLLTVGLVAGTWSAPLSAQIAFRGGFNLTELVGGSVAQSESRTGLNFGMGYDLLNIGLVSIGPELHYAQRGAEAFQLAMAGDVTLPAGPAEIALDYVEVPLLARVRAPMLGPVAPYLMGGPVFGWKLDCKVALDAGQGSAAPSCDDILTRDGIEAKVRDYEQGLLLGAGLDLPVLWDLGQLSLEGRFLRGLSRLGEGDGAPDVKNRSFTLLLGYSLGI